MPKIELATYVESLRDELQRCIAMSEGRALRFATDKIELELELMVETEIAGKAEAKFRFFVVDARAEGDIKKESSQNQKIKLSLTPVYKGEKGSIMVAKEMSMDKKI